MKTIKKSIYALLMVALFNANIKAQTTSESADKIKTVIGGVVLVGVITAVIVGGKIHKNKAKKIAAENSLKNKNVKELQVSYLTDNITYSPGSSFPMIIKAVLQDGKELITEGAGKGLTSWDEYTVEVDGGTFDKGVLTVSNNLKDIKNHKVMFKSSLKSDPSIKNDFEIPMKYDANTLANFAGYCGRKGADGTWATTRLVGEGERGIDGGSGQDGEGGGDGQEIEVFVKAAKDPILNKDLLYVKVKSLNTNNTGYYIVDPAKAKITVSANGGCGGSGGAGGYGGSGGKSTATMRGGNGGNGGNGANGANGGNGGKITAYIDPSAEKYSSSIVFTNYGGSGGEAGKYSFPGQGGSGGSAASGSEGKYGNAGTRSGRNGSNGPAPSIINKTVSID